MAEFNVWLLIVGLAAGAAVTWLVMGTIARNDDDVAAEERVTETAWIARTIEAHGGRAPLKLVDQVLVLHRRYLKGGPGLPQPDSSPSESFEAVATEPVAADSTVPEAPKRDAGRRRAKPAATPDPGEPGAPVAS